MKVTPVDINTLRKAPGRVQGIPPEEQRFVYDYSVQPGAVMDPTHGTSMAVRTPDGRVITLHYEPEETVASLQQRVQIFDGRVLEPDEEVRMLFNGKEIDDLRPLADYELPKHGVADLVSSMTFFVRAPQAKPLTLNVNPSDTVQEVKREFQDLELIPDTTKTLSGYKIKPNSTLDLVDANPIYITMPSCLTITIDVGPRNSVLQLKEALQDLEGIPAALQDLEGIPAAHQKTFFAGKPLDCHSVLSLDKKGETLNSLTSSANLWVTNIKTTVSLWITNQVSPASMYGLVKMWDVCSWRHSCPLYQTHVCSARLFSRGATMAMLWACMMTSTATLTMAAVIDLATIANPYSGSTLGNADQMGVCGSGPEQGFSYVLAPGGRIVIGQKSNNFDSMHTLRYGGQFPGEVLVSCIDDPDETKIEFSNTGVKAVTVYFIIDGYDDAGKFKLEWDVQCPAGSVSSALCSIYFFLALFCSLQE
jgi:hypothetical protein